MHKQRGFFLLQEYSVICWKSAKWGTFPKKTQAQQHWVLFLKRSVKTTSFSDKVTTWQFVGTETAFFFSIPLHSSSSVSVSWCCTQSCSKTAIWLLLEEFTCMLCTALLGTPVSPPPPSYSPSSQHDKHDSAVLVPSITTRKILLYRVLPASPSLANPPKYSPFQFLWKGIFSLTFPLK